MKKGQSKKLTKKFCAFTLNNSKTKIELRDPTGEIVQKLKYDRMKNKITDDETYELAGKNWSWNAPENNIAQGNLKAEPPIGGSASEEIPEENNIPTGEVLIAPASEIQANIGKFTPDISWNNKKTSRIQLISYGTVINTPTNLLEPQGRVAGASIEKYTPPEKHWATVLFDNSVRKINFSLNLILKN